MKGKNVTRKKILKKKKMRRVLYESGHMLNNKNERQNEKNIKKKE